MIIDNLSYEMLSPDFTGNLATAIMTIPPNTASSENVLEHKGEELAFVLDGTITLHLNEEEYILETGDSVKIPAYLKHKWVNQFEKNTIVLFSVTPPIFNICNKIATHGHLPYMAIFGINKIPKLITTKLIICCMDRPNRTAFCSLMNDIIICAIPQKSKTLIFFPFLTFHF